MASRSQSIARLEEHQMTSQDIIDTAKGLVTAAKSSNINPPLRVTLPAGTHLLEHEEGENVTLEQRIKDVSPDITEVTVGRTRGVSVESIGDEDIAKKKSGY